MEGRNIVAMAFTIFLVHPRVSLQPHVVFFTLMSSDLGQKLAYQQLPIGTGFINLGVNDNDKG